MKSRSILLTFDIENDCGLRSFKGIDIGLPQILRVLNKYDVPATFFVTGEVAERFPKIIQTLSEKYEIGCHGFYHESFRKINANKISYLKQAKNLLEEITGRRILGFRAPFLHVCPELFDALKSLGFIYDSSLIVLKKLNLQPNSDIKEFWLMFPNVFFRFPLGYSIFWIGTLLSSISVLYFHPWEAIDVRSLFFPQPHYFRNLFSRPDRWLNSGSPFLGLLSEFIHSHLDHGFQFKSMRDFL
jgi:hypothetical protein